MERPVLNPMQRTWLQEIGIDSRMLAHFSAAPFAGEPPLVRGASTPVAEVAAGPVVEAPAAKLQAATVTEVAVARITAVTRAPELRPAAAAAMPMLEGLSLAQLREQTAACQACGLHEVRGRTVFGEGAEQAPQWMFVGEAPGEYDDSTGRPFQGRAGQLLQAMLASVGIKPDSQVYFTNVLKCRPMGNRSPEAIEVDTCMPFLRRQITLLRPGCLVALGRVSAAALLGRDEELDSLRSGIHAYVDDNGRSIPLVVTHHPASLLLHARLKADAWRDLNLLRNL